MPTSTATPTQQPSPAMTQRPLTPTPGSLAIDDLRRQFAYDASAPLDAVEAGTTDLKGVIRHDLTFASPHGGRVPAYLFVPEAGDSLAGIVMLPGLGGTRSDQATQAGELARRGAVVITLTASHNRDGHQALFTHTAQDREELIQTTIDLERAVDLLLTTKRVDPKRIGYVGFSHGAAMGGILAGVERRIAAYVLQSGGSLAFLKRDGALPSGSSQADYLRLMATVDQINYIGHAAPAELLLQNGKLDTFWTQAEHDAWHAAASEPKDVRWYEGGHQLDAQAWRDAEAFLVRTIGITSDAPS